MDRWPTSSGEADATVREVVELKRRLQVLQGRYSDPTPDGLERLERGMARRSKRVEHLNSQIRELEIEVATLETELVGYRKGALLLLSDAVQTMEASHEEGWSPVPVLGYRIWSVRWDGFWGVAVRWPTPMKVAECRATDDSTDIPHSNGLCGRLGCGIYASKKLRPLFYERPPTGRGALAVGIVELTGKVIEHQRGYRAANAQAVALVISGVGEPMATDDPSRIDRLFADPNRYLNLSLPSTPDLSEWLDIEQHLDIEQRRYEGWT